MTGGEIPPPTWTQGNFLSSQGRCRDARFCVSTRKETGDRRKFFLFGGLKFTNDYTIIVIAKIAKLATNRMRLTMISVNATELKNRMGRYLQQAVSEPVIIEKTHRPFAVILSYDEYERLRSLEDSYWIEKAKQAEKEGFVGVEESMKFIREATSVET